MSKKPQSKKKIERILPEGYYQCSTTDPSVVFLKQGPFKGLALRVSDKLKVRRNMLDNQPNLLYNYDILDSYSYDLTDYETSRKVNRIVAAIVIELFEEQIKLDGKIESVECKTLE